MWDDDRIGWFRGQELPRLLLLLALSLVGWAVLWGFMRSPPPPAPDAPLTAADGAPWPEPDRSPEFETVRDKTPLSFRENAAYSRLLSRARETTPASLAREARRDVLFSHLWDRPSRFRGVPVHLLGSARRVVRYDSKLTPGGWLYEAWVFTPESQSHPYVCVFEDAPKDLPLGTDLNVRVVFNGYFLKLMRYEAGDVPRAAPLLVGRIGWTPEPAPAADSPWRSTYWLALGLAVMFVISLLRWLGSLMRALRRRSGPIVPRTDVPNDDIAPEALASWVDRVAERGGPDDEGDEGGAPGS